MSEHTTHHNDCGCLTARYEERLGVMEAEVDRLTGVADDYWKAQKVAEAARDKALEVLRWFIVKWDDGFRGESFAPNVEQARAVLASRGDK